MNIIETKASGDDLAERLLVDERTAARMLSLSPRTLFNLRLKFGLPFLKVGHKTLYRPQDLATWLKNRVTASNAA